MKHYHYFNDDINIQNVTTLVNDLQAKEGEICLWFATEGGYTNAMEYLIDYLNNRPEIKVVLTDSVCSAGTLFLSDYNHPLEIKDIDCIFFHATDREKYSIRKGAVCGDRLKNQDIEDNKKRVEVWKQRGWLTDKQGRSILKGKDVVLYRKEIFDILAQNKK